MPDRLRSAHDQGFRSRPFFTFPAPDKFRNLHLLLFSYFLQLSPSLSHSLILSHTLSYSPSLLHSYSLLFSPTLSFCLLLLFSFSPTYTPSPTFLLVLLHSDSYLKKSKYNQSKYYLSFPDPHRSGTLAWIRSGSSKK